MSAISAASSAVDASRCSFITATFDGERRSHLRRVGELLLERRPRSEAHHPEKAPAAHAGSAAAAAAAARRRHRHRRRWRRAPRRRARRVELRPRRRPLELERLAEERLELVCVADSCALPPPSAACRASARRARRATGQPLAEASVARRRRLFARRRRERVVRVDRAAPRRDHGERRRLDAGITRRPAYSARERIRPFLAVLEEARTGEHVVEQLEPSMHDGGQLRFASRSSTTNWPASPVAGIAAVAVSAERPASLASPLWLPVNARWRSLLYNRSSTYKRRLVGAVDTSSYVACSSPTRKAAYERAARRTR